jgi:hypothetical protein
MTGFEDITAANITALKTSRRMKKHSMRKTSQVTSFLRKQESTVTQKSSIASGTGHSSLDSLVHGNDGILVSPGFCNHFSTTYYRKY